MRHLSKHLFHTLLLALCASVTSAQADMVSATIAIYSRPGPLAVNSVTNKIYVANWNGGNVTVIDGATNAISTVNTGEVAYALAVNSTTNKIYAANWTNGNVTVIDGATNTTTTITTVTTGGSPQAVAVNSATNMIYVAGGSANVVAVIDGVTNVPINVPTGSNPQSVAVNAVTNKIYVVNNFSTFVAVIDGATNTTTTVPVGMRPDSVAVNTETNKIYVTNSESNTVTVIDGATNATSTVPTGTNPYVVAVNSVTNKIYVTNVGSSNVTVIDGFNPNTPSTVAVGMAPADVVVNSVTNKVYVVNRSSNTVTVIDGATNATSTLSTGTYPTNLAVNSVTNKIYVSNSNSNNVTVIDGASNVGRLINLSTRGQVQTGDNVMIGGFIIGGSSPKKVLIRAVGPNLVNYGVTGVLADPTLQLFSGQTPIAFNDDWGSASNFAEIQASSFAPANSKESAILSTLSPGAYTAIVSGIGGGTGVGIVEVFELDRPDIPLINMSTRGRVQTGDNVMIGGFIIQGDSPKTVLIRAVGPNLLNYGVTGVLADPMLQLYSGQSVVAQNDNWQDATNALAIQATGLAPANSMESAILITLPPGAYTVIVSGANGGTGVGIVEVFAR